MNTTMEDELNLTEIENNIRKCPEYFFLDTNTKTLRNIVQKLNRNIEHKINISTRSIKLDIFNKILKYYRLTELTYCEIEDRKQVRDKVKKQLSLLTREVEKKQRIIKQQLKPPKAGTKVKTRASSTRNAFTISVSEHNGPDILLSELKDRNTRLRVVPDKCFWCKKAKKEENDHAHPCCNTTEHEYSYTNVLNIFPSCKSCNSKKNGKKLEHWINQLSTLDWWSPEEIAIFNKWCAEFKDKLLFNKEDTVYVEKQFPIINKIHEILETCAKDKTDTREAILMGLQDSNPDRLEAYLS